jgi:hypothetical protein
MKQHIDIRKAQAMTKVFQLQKCMTEKCSNERNVLFKKIKGLTKKLQKATEKNDFKTMYELTLKMYQTAERLKLVECQINHCKKDTKELIKATFKIGKNNPAIDQVFLEKYKKLFKNDKNLTAHNVNQFDIDGLHLKYKQYLK